MRPDFSTTVVPQIIVDNDQARVKDGLPVEAHITAGLSHVNVVRTIAHAWRPLNSHVSASMSVWDSAGSALGPTNVSDGETWLLLELCDRGTLQVRAHGPPQNFDNMLLGGCGIPILSLQTLLETYHINPPNIPCQ